MHEPDGLVRIVPSISVFVQSGPRARLRAHRPDSLPILVIRWRYVKSYAARGKFTWIPIDRGGCKPAVTFCRAVSNIKL
jgi:hypothetical protein